MNNRPYVSVKDIQLFFEHENWSFLLEQKVGDWAHSTDNYGRDFITLIFSHAPDNLIENLEKLINAGYPIENKLFFDLPYHIGLYDDASAYNIVHYLAYVQSLGLDISSVDERGNNLFARYEKSFNAHIFNYLLDNGVEVPIEVVAGLINTLGRETIEYLNELEYFQNINIAKKLEFSLHDGAIGEREQNNQKIIFIQNYLEKTKHQLQNSDYQLCFEALHVPYEKLLEFYAQEHNHTEVMELYREANQKNEKMFYPNQLKVIHALEACSGYLFLEKAKVISLNINK